MNYEANRENYCGCIRLIRSLERMYLNEKKQYLLHKNPMKCASEWEFIIICDNTQKVTIQLQIETHSEQETTLYTDESSAYN